MDWLTVMKDAKAKQEALLAKAKEENRAFTDEEKAKFAEHQAEIENAQAMIEAEKKVAATNKHLNDPADPPAPRVDPKDDGPKWKAGFGEFLIAVRNAKLNPANTDPRLVQNAALGSNEGSGEDGAFLVEPEHAPAILKRAYELSQVASRCTRNSISSNRVTLNYVKETSRANGYRQGGVLGYWIPEAGTITASTPKFGQMELKLKKLAGLYYASEEVLEDAVALESFATQAFADEFAFLLDEAVFSGSGTQEPLGVFNAGCKVDVAIEAGQTAATIVFENIVKMWARMWGRSRANAAWFINQDIEPELMTMAQTVGTGGVSVYMPANGLSASPYSTLMGRPVIPCEHCETLGTVGDIVLADMSQYLLVDKGGLKRADSIHVQFATDQHAFRFIYRVDGQPKWQSALTPAKGSNTLSPFVRLATRS